MLYCINVACVQSLNATAHILKYTQRLEKLIFLYLYLNNTIYVYSGITSGRVLDGELLCTKILEVNLFAFAYRLFHRDFSPINRA